MTEAIAGTQGTIWKTELHFDPASQIAEVGIPQGARILHCHTQQDVACIWYLCDPTLPKATRRFAVVPTGDEAPWPAAYVGTIHVVGGQLVFHIFELVGS